MPDDDKQSVIARTFSLLRAFEPGRRSDVSLDELAAASGLARSTAHRLAVQLEREGALERSKRGWRLGMRMFELGQLVPRTERLRDVALAYMEDLYEATRETVQLAVPDGGEVLYIEIISGHRKVSTPSRRGGRMPVHCTGLGKVLLAFSDDVGRGFLAEHDLPRRTPKTLTNRSELQNELHEVRRTGFGYDREESREGLHCVAAPILHPDGSAIAALSVSMPTEGAMTLAEAAPALRAAANGVTRQLRAARMLGPPVA